MTPTIIVSIALLFVLLVIGVPVALSFFLSAMVVAIGSGASLSLLMSYSYKNTSSIILLTIPLFIMAAHAPPHDICPRHRDLAAAAVRLRDLSLLFQRQHDRHFAVPSCCRFSTI